MDDKIKQYFHDRYMVKPKAQDLGADFYGNPPEKTTIKEAVEYLIANNYLDKIIEHNFAWNHTDEQGPFLLKVAENNYEAFVSERGGKHFLKKFDTIEGALFGLVDLIYCNLSIKVTDSIMTTTPYKEYFDE